MIKIRDLSFRYANSRQKTLEHINMNIGKGEWIVIQGPSGCGKTTLALAMAGFLFHIFNGDYQGSIALDNKPMEELTLAEITDQVFLVQQNPENQFCTLTVRDEIAFGLENRCIPPQRIMSRIRQALEIVHGERLLKSNLLELSGGEKQKIAIATAIAMKPRIIILDEPTSNLDPVSIQEVFQALDQMKKLDGITVIIIEHKLRQILPYATRIYHMESGSVSEVDPREMAGKATWQKKVHKARQTKIKWEPLVYVKNYSVKRQEKAVVEIDELLVYPGEIVALMGPNGSGKTSLLLGLLGLLDRSFEIGQFLGRDMRALKTHAIARDAGYVFQNPDHQIFCDSVEEEIFMAPKNYQCDIGQVRTSVSATLAGFGLDEKMDVHPLQLSYGQKKRLNLASVLAYEPKLLLLDEIFIGQDDDNIQFALEILDDYVENHQAGVVLVNHYIHPLVNLADRLLFMEEGRLLIDAPMRCYAAELKKNKKPEYLAQ